MWGIVERIELRGRGVSWWGLWGVGVEVDRATEAEVGSASGGMLAQFG